MQGVVTIQVKFISRFIWRSGLKSESWIIPKETCLKKWRSCEMWWNRFMRCGQGRGGVKLRQPLSQLEIPVSKMDSKFLGILKEEVNVRGVIFGKELRLDTAMTPQLRLQGLTRELERQINQFRKEAGLRVGEEIDLRYETESANIKKAMEAVDRKKKKTKPKK